jgi:hypothetical protein
MKNKSLVKTFFLHGEIARLAKGKPTVTALPATELLKWAARELRAQRVVQAAKAAGDVQFLARLFSLEDPR